MSQLANVNEASYTVADALASAGVKDTAAFEHLTMPFTLKNHQIIGLNTVLRKDLAGLFFEARCGKSIVFQLAAIYCAHYGLKSVILMPPILFKQFVDSWEEIEGSKPKVHVFKQGPRVRKNCLERWETSPGNIATNGPERPPIFPGGIKRAGSVQKYSGQGIGGIPEKSIRPFRFRNRRNEKIRR